MAAAAAVTCGLVPHFSRLNSQAAQSASAGTSCGRCLLVWDPLPSSRMLQVGGASSQFSAAPSSSALGSRRIAPSRSRATPVRSSSDGDAERRSEASDSDRQEFADTAKELTTGAWNYAAKPAIVAALAAVLLMQPTEDALAASGGRMGGKSFSAPSRSYSGGGGGGGGRSYSGGGGLGGGRMYSAPPVYGNPLGGYSPFYGGGYGGGMFFGPSIGFGGGGSIILAMIAFATLRSVVGFLRDRFSGNQDQDDDRFDE